jgi:hypothetical protein
MEFNRPTGPSRAGPETRRVRLERVARVLVWSVTFLVVLFALALAVGAIGYAFGVGLGFVEVLLLAVVSAVLTRVIVRRLD